MRILVSTFSYPPNLDGVASAAASMVKIFQRAGHQIAVATGHAPGAGAEVVQAGNLLVRRFAIQGSPAFGNSFRGEVDKYLRFIDEFRPDVVFFHCWDMWTSEIPVKAIKHPSFKMVLVSHGYASHLLEGSRFPRGILRWLRWLPHVIRLPYRMRRYDRVVFLSRQCDFRRFFDAMVAKVTRYRGISVIPNSVERIPELAADSFRARYSIRLGTFFLCIANYSPRKNQKCALRAFAEAGLSNATLVFIGSELGEYGRMLASVWQEIKVPGKSGNVIFLEGLDRGETLAALRDCDVQILSADAETQPIVLLEAMAAGKPFISTRTGCVSELKGGLTVGNASDMAAAMVLLANSAEERRKLGEQGRREYEQNYNTENVSRAWIELLHGLGLSEHST